MIVRQYELLDLINQPPHNGKNYIFSGSFSSVNWFKWMTKNILKFRHNNH